jgi:glycosyltransferase involved in cell wall biosynthesis
MKIAVDGYELGREAKGVGRTVHNILTRLVDLRPADTFMVFSKESLGKYDRPNIQEHTLPSARGYLRWLNGPLRRALKRAEPNLLLATNYVLPLGRPWNSILFEHDISVISHPEWYSRKYALTRKWLIRRSLNKAARIVVPSDFTRDEIQRHFDVPGDRMKVVYYGVEETFRRPPEDGVRLWKNRKGLDGRKVIGCLGSLFKRRHIPTLIRAAGFLRREIPEIVLYLVGQNCGGLGREEINEISRSSWIIWEQALPEEDLPLYYSSLSAFAYLSEYEGFGFPPLEALACGTPVVLLKRSSLQEIFSGVAVMVEEPTREFVESALRTALVEEETRRRLLVSFEARRAEFSWENTAGAVSDLIENI